ncbi:MAG: ABC transporter permease [Lachnospiraceae bacterium]|nr:ABC transporter permease [Lachnospiraceae bacterium]
MNYLRSVFGKKQFILAITGAISLIVFLILTTICCVTASKQKNQQFAKRWCNDGSYVQLSAFLSELSGMEEKTVMMIQGGLENQLTMDSIVAPNENARRVVMAYSAQGEVELSSGKSEVTVNAYGVGGDFFLFHPLEIVYGSYFDGDDIMKDHVILDTETAWNLFGSPNVVGQVITVGGRQHVISGVVKKEKGRLNDLAGNDVPTIFVSLESLQEFGNITYLNSIEALLPNPISGYAKGIFQKALNLEERRFEVVENTGRFSWQHLVMNAKNFGLRGMNKKGLVYPYWENVARGTEDILTPICIAAIVFVSYPSILLIALLIRMWRKRTIHKKDVWNFIQAKLEDYRESRRRRIEDNEYE